MHRSEAIVVGPMPPYYKIAYHLWGQDCDFDSDGDSNTPESTNWRELTIRRRPNYDERVDIDPIDGDQDRICIRSESQDLTVRVYKFLEDMSSIKGL